MKVPVKTNADGSPIIIRRKMIKSIAWAVVAGVILLLGLHLVNFFRLQGPAFHSSAARLLERSSQIRKQARPGYQNEVLASLPSNLLNGAFLRLDNQLPAAASMRASAVTKDNASVRAESGFEFDQPGQAAMALQPGDRNLPPENGVLRVRCKDGEYLTNSGDLRIPNDEIAEVIIRARADKGTMMRFGWRRNSDPIPPDSGESNLWYYSIDVNLIADNKYHSYVINARNIFKWGLAPKDEVRRILLRPSDAEGAIAEIDYIRFVPKLAKYSGRPYGTTYESFAEEMRPAIYMLPGNTVEYSVKIPDDSPTLDLGTAILFDQDPIDFRVTIHDGNRQRQLYKGVVSRADSWNDVRIDLSDWAGMQVRLSMHASGSGKNVAFWSNPLISSQPRKRFNVVIVLEDCLRADRLSVYGYGRQTSPIKEKLFENAGVLFLNAVSQETKTKPSVASMMTSLLPSVTGVWQSSDQLSDNYLTMAEVMRSQGFITAAFIQNDFSGPNAGIHQGFSQFYHGNSAGKKTEAIFDGALPKWLEKNRERNFFLYLHILDPHGPYNPPSPYDSWYRESTGKDKPVPRWYLDPKWNSNPTAEGRRLLYDGEVRHNDAVIARLIDMLSSLRIDRDTLIIFTADHGEHLGEHGGVWEHHPPGYRQVIGVPLMFLYPERFDQGKRIAETVQLADIMPTVLELAGISRDKILMQGDSLVDLIEGRNLSFWRERISVSEEVTDMSKGQMHTWGSFLYHNWHLISTKTVPRIGGVLLPGALWMGVIDYEQDPNEAGYELSFLPDLYVRWAYARLMRRLQSNSVEAYKAWTKGESGDTYALDPDAVNRLRSIGYLK